MGDEYQGARKQKKLRTYEAKLAMDFLRMIGGWDGTSNGRSDAAKSKSVSVLSPFYPVLPHPTISLVFRLCKACNPTESHRSRWHNSRIPAEPLAELHLHMA